MAIASGDTQEDVDRVRREAGIEYRVLLDSDGFVAKAYGIVSSPTCMVVGPGGEIRYRGSRTPEEVR